MTRGEVFGWIGLAVGLFAGWQFGFVRGVLWERVRRATARTGEK